MSLEVLKQWICDKCGEVIENPEDGWLEFCSDRDNSKYGDFKIVHHAPKSPYKESRRGCYHYADNPDEESSSLIGFLGPDGMATLITWVYEPGVKDPSEWAKLFRRLHLPYYEEARLYWHRADADGYFADTAEETRYSQDVLKEIIEKYSPG
jgi:hypothetical protein